MDPKEGVALTNRNATCIACTYTCLIRMQGLPTDQEHLVMRDPYLDRCPVVGRVQGTNLLVAELGYSAQHDSQVAAHVSVRAVVHMDGWDLCKGLHTAADSCQTLCADQHTLQLLM